MGAVTASLALTVGATANPTNGDGNGGGAAIHSQAGANAHAQADGHAQANAHSGSTAAHAGSTGANAHANVHARAHANAGVSSESHGTASVHANVHARAGLNSSSHPNGRALGFFAGRGHGHVSGGVSNGAKSGASVHVTSHTAGAGQQGKVTTCHATDSMTNPFVAITISMNALPAHMTNHVRAVGWQDFVLSSGETSCAAGRDSAEHPGQRHPGQRHPAAPSHARRERNGSGHHAEQRRRSRGDGYVPERHRTVRRGQPRESLGKTSPAVLHRKLGAPESGVAGETVAATSTKSSGSLPFTGFQALLALLVAGGILGTGVIVRKLAAARR